MGRVSQKKFDGKCEECGDIAEMRDARATALLQNQENRALSTIGTKLVVGSYCGHAYYVLDWETQVDDPFGEDETSIIADQFQFDIELPPPPKEDA